VETTLERWEIDNNDEIFVDYFLCLVRGAAMKSNWRGAVAP
jgi:hypothetical protein